MTIALLRGNLETRAIWDPLARHLPGLGHPDPVRSATGSGTPVRRSSTRWATGT